MVECIYCGKMCKDAKGLASHRRYSKNCYDKWKAEQDEIANSKTYVYCRICGEKLRNISNTHLQKHNITQQEYKEMYPDAPIFSEGLLDIQRQNRESTIAERYSDIGNKIHDCASLDFFMRKFEDEELAYKAWIERKENTAYNVSRYGYIDKYGEFEGNRLFDLRYQKGAYHRSLAGLIERFGEEEGTKIYNERKERNKLSKSKECVIQNRGEDYYNALCAKKALTLENFIRKYGDDLGTQKFLEYVERMQTHKNLLKNCIGNVC